MVELPWRRVEMSSKTLKDLQVIGKNRECQSFYVPYTKSMNHTPMSAPGCEAQSQIKLTLLVQLHPVGYGCLAQLEFDVSELRSASRLFCAESSPVAESPRSPSLLT